MVTRRRFLQGSATALALLGTRFATSPAFAAGLAGSDRDVSGAKAAGLTRYVDPFIGTGGHGHTYPGATLQTESLARTGAEQWAREWIDENF